MNALEIAKFRKILTMLFEAKEDLCKIKSQIEDMVSEPIKKDELAWFDPRETQIPHDRLGIAFFKNPPQLCMFPPVSALLMRQMNNLEGSEKIEDIYQYASLGICGPKRVLVGDPLMDNFVLWAALPYPEEALC